MADKNKAEIEVGVKLDPSVTQAAEKALNPWSTYADKAKNAVKSAGQEIGRAFQQVASDVVRTLTVANTISFSQAMASARLYKEELARLSVSGGTSLEALRLRIGTVSRSKLLRDEDVTKFVRAMKAFTYDTTGAVTALGGLADEATATGRSIEEMQPLGALLKNSLGVAGDTATALGMIRAQAEALGTTGGPAALHDRLVAISDVLSEVSIKTDEDRNKITAFAAGIGKGWSNPEAGKRAVARLLGDVVNDPRGYERFLGLKRGALLDEQGHVKDPTAVLEQSRAKLLRLSHGDVQMARFLASGQFGTEGAAALFSADFGAIRAAAKSAPSGKAADIAKTFAEGEGGQMIGAQRDIERNTRDAAERLLPISNFYTSFAADHPILGNVGGPLAATAATKIGGNFASKIWGSIFGGGGAAAGGGAAGGGGAAAGAGGGAAGAAGGGGAAAGGLGAGGGIAVGAVAAPLAVQAVYGAAWVDAASELAHKRGQIEHEMAGQFEVKRRRDAELIVQAAAQSGGTAEGFAKALGPGLMARTDYDPALKAVAEGLVSGEINLADLPNEVRQGVIDGFKAAPALQAVVNVQSADGSPVVAAEQQKAQAPRN